MSAPYPAMTAYLEVQDFKHEGEFYRLMNAPAGEGCDDVLEVDIGANLCLAEPDVGIMSGYCEDLIVTTLDEQAVEDLLTDKALERLAEKYCVWANDRLMAEDRT